MGDIVDNTAQYEVQNTNSPSYLLLAAYFASGGYLETVRMLTSTFSTIIIDKKVSKARFNSQ